MESLQNQFLIAMPSLDDSFFERSVIYVCEHDNKGAMGVMINRLAGVSIESVLQQMKLTEEEIILPPNMGNNVLVGGPVSTDRGFVLHPPKADGQWTNSTAISDDIMLTTSRDVLIDLGTSKGPEQYLVALGYAGWANGQLEQELADNLWLTTPADQQTLFHLAHELRWQQASRSLGFDTWQLSSQTGHA